ncbi:glycerophosphodiester phosphodiesterase family protein [Psychrobacillus vulpis]|uniref:Glycerophosphodiester phosphodiesterase n=1 Tax=Psychrobacillus vulpis TaxID=2325572 RepID=A0A544TSK6_9BACI|nr:glycerophosphodiester phosphodiesterase family protein [Psychrobacillus vulpis]TQR20427.1 glycerophosphodiester phosphodiesterase [Psychrobacillus vulpis]
MRKQYIILAFLLLVVGCVHTEKRIEPIPSEEFLVIAHRGASAYAPEHTLLAYEIAQQAEATYIEIDLQMTEDGVLVAMHDEKVDRTTDGTGFVKEYTLKELKLLNAGEWFNNEYPGLANEEFEDVSIPTLEEIFIHFGSEVNYYIEMKSPGIYDEMEEKLIALLKQYNLIYVDKGLPKVIIESFNEDSLVKIHQLEPRLPLIKLFSFKEEAALSVQDYNRLNTYASGIGVNISSVDKHFIREVQQNGLQIHLYSVNDETELKKTLNLKANGVFTNIPNIAVELLKQQIE